MKRIICITLALLTGLSAAGLALAKRDAPADEDVVPVQIKEMKFSPQSLKIQVGQTVEWTNADTRDHTVIADDGSFESGNLSRGDRFTHTFEQPGTFRYGCSYHPRMKGKIIVEK